MSLPLTLPPADPSANGSAPHGRRRPPNPAFRKAAAKLVVFVVVALVITSSVVATLLDETTATTVTYHALVSDVTGLQAGDTVRIAGVQVGQVTGVALRRDTAYLTFTADRSDPLPRQVHADVRFADLLGQRYLDLVAPPGAPTDPPPADRLAAGATIPTSRTAPSLDLTEVFNGFQPLFTALQPNQVNQLTGEIIAVLQGQTGVVGSLVANTASVVTNLAARQHVITQVIDNLTTLVRTVGAHDRQIGQLIAGLDQLAGGLAGDGPAIGTAITSVGQLEGSVAGLLGQAQPAIQQDISGLAQSTATLAAHQSTLDANLTELPGLLTSLNKISQSGNYLNVYICNLTLNTTGELWALAAPISLPSGPVGNQSVHTAVCR